MEHSEKAAAQLNSRFATMVLTRTADIIEGAVETGGAWDVEEAIRQSSREFRDSHPLLEGPEPNYGPTPLLWHIAEYIRIRNSAWMTYFPQPTGPVRAWAEAIGPGEVAAALREAAPVIARQAEEWTIRVSPALRKLASIEITEEELRQMIREARRA